MSRALRDVRAFKRKKHMAIFRISFAFARLADSPLLLFILNVIEKLTSNPGFTTPVIKLEEMTDIANSFNAAITAAEGGDRQLIAAKNVAREAVLAALRREGAYVQSIAGENLPLLLSSGFLPVSTNRTRIQLPTPVVERIENPMSTKIGLRLQPVPTAAAYEIRMRYGANGWESVGVFTQARSILVDGRIPGTVYEVQARAVGGLTGYSGWTEPVSHMAT